MKASNFFENTIQVETRYYILQVPIYNNNNDLQIRFYSKPINYTCQINRPEQLFINLSPYNVSTLSFIDNVCAVYIVIICTHL